MGRPGKIARLPKSIREELNRRLSDGEPASQLVRWLNGLPDVQNLVAAGFAGRPVREQNISEWKQAGYRDWLRQQEALDLLRNLSCETGELLAAAGDPITDKLSLWLAARYAVAARKLADLEPGGDLDWRRLRELCNDVVALRRGDHSAARLKIEQELLERGRELGEGEDVVKRFERWATLPKVREWICRDCASNPDERQRHLLQIFGLTANATPPVNSHENISP
jgi:hypothetical protein